MAESTQRMVRTIATTIATLLWTAAVLPAQMDLSDADDDSMMTLAEYTQSTDAASESRIDEDVEFEIADPIELSERRSWRSFFGGWVQQGFTYNLDDPVNRLNAPVLFNDRANDYRLNQLNLFAELPVLADASSWQVGGRIDVMYGSDSRFVTVPGLEENRDGTTKWNSDSADYGVALPQVYLELAAPWADGFSMKIGHFYSMIGYETFAAPDNLFYSHAYTFLYGEPFTLTGALCELQLGEHMTLHAGATNGWDVFDSLSNTYGALAGISLANTDRSLLLKAFVHSGADVTNVRTHGALTDEDRHFFSIVLQRRINPWLDYVFQHDFGYQEDSRIVVNRPTQTITLDTAKWYGVNQYLIYHMNEWARAALRVEWFRDQDHSRLGLPVTFSPGGKTLLGGNYIATTLGLMLSPHPNILIRPEVRWDYSDTRGNPAAPGGNASLRPFDDKQQSSQFTAGFDVTIAF